MQPLPIDPASTPALALGAWGLLWLIGVRRARSEPASAPGPGEGFGAERLGRLVDALGDGYVAFSFEVSGRIRYLSPAAAGVLGRPLSELQDSGDCLTTSKLNRDGAERLEAIANGPGHGTYRIELRHADGRAVPMEVHVTVVRDGRGRLLGFDGIGRDLSVADPRLEAAEQRCARAEGELAAAEERLRATSVQLRETHERLTQLSTAVRALLWIYEPSSDTILFSNGAAKEVLDLPVEALLGGPGWWDGIHPEDRARFDEEREALARNGSYAISYRWRAQEDDEWRWMWERGTGQFDSAGELHRVFGTTEDVSSLRRREDERLQLEAQLLQAQKMETVGQLAGGVAHDFNNLLTVISAHAELMSAEVEPGSELSTSLAAVEDAVTQATRVSRALLGFSRPARSRSERVDVGRLVGDLGRMVQRILPSTIDCRLPERGEDGPFARLDPSRLQQVLLNLALSAREAMPKGGSLAFNVQLVDDEANPVEIAVADSGPARAVELPDEFESSLGLRPDGGESLGLAVARRLIGEMGGELSTVRDSRAGHCWRIRLPLDPVEEAQPAPQHAAAPGGRSVVLAEDDAQVRSVLASVLDSAGYVVHQAGTGDDLLELARRRGSSVDLYIIDGDLPNRTGIDCLRLLRGEGAGQPALLISGSPPGDEPDLGPHEFLSKPFQLDQMLGAIPRLLSPRDANRP